MGKRKQVPSPPYAPAFADVLAGGDQYRTRGQRSEHAERRAVLAQQQSIRAERLAEQSPPESPGQSGAEPRGPVVSWAGIGGV